ncbi:MAG: glycosyltransferase family 4 protein [Chloroflexi bacterium]|nr:glycosyltransferase family 4 protein [Chloroflexota bacterium]
MKWPVRVLCIDSAPSLGGSVVSLYQLVRGIDRGRFVPTVLLYANNPYVPRFRALGIDVHVWDVYDTAKKRDLLVGRVRSSPWAIWARSGQRRKALYHALGFAVALLQKVRPLAQGIAMLVREGDFDLVHTNCRVGHDRAGVWAARMAGVPCVAHIRHPEALNAFDRWLAKGIKWFIYISKAVEAAQLAQGLPAGTGSVVYNGVDLAEFEAVGDRTVIRASLGFDEDDLVVGMVGRLEEWKGQLPFVEVVGRLVSEFPRLRALIVGAPEPYSVHYETELHALVRERGLENRVIFAGLRQDIPAIMSALDILVQNSLSPEPFGRAMIEAMAAGRPVIATAHGAAPEIVVEGETGLLVPPSDQEALASALAMLLRNEGVRAKMGRAGRQRVEEYFTAARYVQGVEDVYCRVLSEVS